MKDLTLIVADKNMHFALKGALARPAALGIRPISVEFSVHPNRDGGMRSTGPELLALKRRTARYGLLVLDREGCGVEKDDADGLETELMERMKPVWGTAAAALVIEPEVDIWMWGADNALKTVLGWDHTPSIREWITTKGYILDANGKPVRPKEALDAILRELAVPRSAALYEELASKLSLKRCADPAFVRLRTILHKWFSTSGESD